MSRDDAHNYEKAECCANCVNASYNNDCELWCWKHRFAVLLTNKCEDYK